MRSGMVERRASGHKDWNDFIKIYQIFIKLQGCNWVDLVDKFPV